MQYTLTHLVICVRPVPSGAIVNRFPIPPDGSWGVRLVVKAQKLKGDSVGNTKEVPIADYVDVGVFGDRVPGQKLGELLLVKR